MDQEAVRVCCNEVLGVVEARLQYLKDIEEVSGEEGEVVLRHSMQLCQWISVLEPFIPDANLLLESLLEVTSAIAFKAKQSQLRRKGRPSIPISEEQMRFSLSMTSKMWKWQSCLCSRRTIE